MSENSNSTHAKGTVANPYTWEEFRSMLKSHTWPGGFVSVEDDVAKYYEPFQDYITGSSDGCGSDEGSDGDDMGSDGEDEGSDGDDMGSDDMGSDDEIDESIYGPGGGIPAGSDPSTNGKDCFYRCLGYAANIFGISYTSEDFGLNYLRGDYIHGWEGTQDVNQYQNGPYSCYSDGTYNTQLLDFSNCYFNADGSFNDNLSSLKNELSSNNGVQNPSRVTIAVFKSNDNQYNQNYHAVIAISSNNGLLYIYDPQTGGFVSQADNDRYKDSRFLYSFGVERKPQQ